MSNLKKVCKDLTAREDVKYEGLDPAAVSMSFSQHHPTEGKPQTYGTEANAHRAIRESFLSFSKEQWHELCDVLTPADVELLNFNMQCDAYDVLAFINGHVFNRTFDVELYRRRQVLHTVADPIDNLKRVMRFKGRWEVGKLNEANGLVIMTSFSAYMYYGRAMQGFDKALRCFFDDIDVCQRISQRRAERHE